MKNRALHGSSFDEGLLLGETHSAGCSLAPPAEIVPSQQVDANALDAVLVARARDCDETAFGALYERHYAAVTRVCRRWLFDDQLVEDAVQETFLRAWTALDRFEGGDFGRWVRRIARNHCHSLWRSWRVRPVDLVGDTVIDVTDPATPPDSVDGLALRRALAQLEPRDAALLLQRHVGELPTATMAATWGLTTASMEVALHRARRRARRFARAEGLRGLLPVPLYRRAVAALQRWWAQYVEAAAGMAEAAVPLLVAAGLSLPMVGVARAEPPPAPSVGPVAAEQRRDMARLTRAADGGHARVTGMEPSRRLRPVRDESSRRATASHDTGGSAPSAVQFEPVAVPGTDRRVGTAPPEGERRSHSVGIRPQSSGAQAPLELEVYEDHPADRAAGDALCAAGDAGEPVTFCDSSQ